MQAHKQQIHNTSKQSIRDKLIKKRGSNARHLRSEIN